MHHGVATARDLFPFGMSSQRSTRERLTLARLIVTVQKILEYALSLKSVASQPFFISETIPSTDIRGQGQLKDLLTLLYTTGISTPRTRVRSLVSLKALSSTKSRQARCSSK